MIMCYAHINIEVQKRDRIWHSFQGFKWGVCHPCCNRHLTIRPHVIDKATDENVGQ